MLGLLKLVLFLRTQHPHLIFITDTSVVQNSSSNVNIAERLGKGDNEVLKIFSEFLTTLDEASVSPNVNRNRLDTFICQKKNVTTTDNRLSGYFCSETIFNLSN